MARNIEPLGIKELHQKLNGAEEVGIASRRNLAWCKLFIYALNLNTNYRDYCSALEASKCDEINILISKFPHIEKLHTRLAKFESIFIHDYEEIAKSTEQNVCERMDNELLQYFYLDHGIFESQKVTSRVNTDGFNVYDYDQSVKERLNSNYIEMRLPILKDKSKLYELAKLQIDYYYETILVSQDEMHKQLANKVPRFVPVSLEKFNIFVPIENEAKLTHFQRCFDILRLYRAAKPISNRNIWIIIESWLNELIENSQTSPTVDSKCPFNHLLGKWTEEDIPTVQSFSKKFEGYKKTALKIVENVIFDKFPMHS